MRDKADNPVCAGNWSFRPKADIQPSTGMLYRGSAMLPFAAYARYHAGSTVRK